MSLRDAIAIASSRREVPPDVLEAGFGEIMDGKATPAQIAGLLVALRTKGETVAEIVAAARALQARATTTEASDPRTLDNCGTGGSGLDTFSISTTSAFVIAGAGVPVAKHGNRAASRATGSFDVLEALGVRIDLPIGICGEILSHVGIAPFFAQTAHPAMRHAASVRRELGVRTIMNCMGPLLNPAGVKLQMVGCYDDALVEPLAAVLGQLGRKRALVVHGSDGLDDLTTTGPSRAALFDAGRVEVILVEPEDLGIRRARSEDLCGGDPAENARVLRAILDGEGGPRRDIVTLNAGAALWVAEAAGSLSEGIERARESIDTGAASEKLSELVRATQERADGEPASQERAE
jgi:anthranilate phosphoribosyltransferase